MVAGFKLRADYTHSWILRVFSNLPPKIRFKCRAFAVSDLSGYVYGKVLAVMLLCSDQWNNLDGTAVELSSCLGEGITIGGS